MNDPLSLPATDLHAWAILSKASPDGDLGDTLEGLAYRLGTSTSTARRRIEGLQAAGVIKVNAAGGMRLRSRLTIVETDVTPGSETYAPTYMDVTPDLETIVEDLQRRVSALEARSASTPTPTRSKGRDWTPTQQAALDRLAKAAEAAGSAKALGEQLGDAVPASSLRRWLRGEGLPSSEEAREAIRDRVGITSGRGLASLVARGLVALVVLIEPRPCHHLDMPVDTLVRDQVAHLDRAGGRRVSGRRVGPPLLAKDTVNPDLARSGAPLGALRAGDRGGVLEALSFVVRQHLRTLGVRRRDTPRPSGSAIGVYFRSPTGSRYRPRFVAIAVQQAGAGSEVVATWDHGGPRRGAGQAESEGFSGCDHIVIATVTALHTSAAVPRGPASRWPA